MTQLEVEQGQSVKCSTEVSVACSKVHGFFPRLHRVRHNTPLTRDVTNLRHHALEGVHDLGAFRVLVVGEDSGDNHDCSQHDAQVELRERKRKGKRLEAAKRGREWKSWRG